MKKLIFSFLVSLVITGSSYAGSYNLEITEDVVNLTGKPVKSITVNHSLPAPILYFQEGEDVIIKVTNKLNINSSIHWHGLLLPGNMDGVPGFNQFNGIEPGASFTYRFKLKQSGTYWYHAHSGTQEQAGLYGAIVIKKKNDHIKSDRDYVVLFSDFTEENPDEILRKLKANPSYYNHRQRTLVDFFSDIKKDGFKSTWNDRISWNKMRMQPTDLADVSSYHFLVNGKINEWTGIFKAGEKIRLRFINASSMSFYDVRIPGLKMSVVSSDGQDVEPVLIDEFRFGAAETYDVLVTPKENKNYPIIAESIDRTGFALGTLSPHPNQKAEIPKHRNRTTLNMSDMGMDDSNMLDMTEMDMANMDHSGMAHSEITSKTEGGWADNGSNPDSKTLSYEDLRSFKNQKDLRTAEREIIVTLEGNMERYIWTLNGKKYEDAEPIKLNYGERVRLKFINKTMMAHPMHLHGMFVQLENGQEMKKLPNKHTVVVPPGKSYSVLISADEIGEWAIHCHLLYHMQAGMMNKVIVAKLENRDKPKITKNHAH